MITISFEKSNHVPDNSTGCNEEVVLKSESVCCISDIAIIIAINSQLFYVHYSKSIYSPV